MTNAIASLAATTLSMSSQEIAEYTGKEHKDVLRDIRTMLDQLEITSEQFCAYVQIPGPNGATRASPIFNLPKDLTLTLVSGYSAPMRHKIVCRWLELEAQVAKPLTYREAMMLAVDNHEKLEAARLQIAMDAPKVALLLA
jgi:phage regulator Rha-like protein